ncbi:MAG: 23S rRNA (adenine(1618)-N(6))-methyltransferase RlmF [Saprospiraceae bacterium]|jgi:23S rRNA (adenine1618-N6)-methyltransferase|nr:23S rRNA (adenine(1618)-N(6))-methyltransferase RlmF [Saprospiraceae bacterium]
MHINQPKSHADKREHPAEKTRLHHRNIHRERYDFDALKVSYPPLCPFITKNIYGDDSIEFANPKAVRALNTSLMMHYYGIQSWDIPEGYLCPPIPGRADYIHHTATLLSQSNYGKITKGEHITVLDIGVGASCVYPVIGVSEYGWTFIGSEIDTAAVTSAQAIIDKNPHLAGKVILRFNPDAGDIFTHIIKPDEYIDMTICNPPFHTSAAEARSGTMRKLKNLNPTKPPVQVLNFGGTSTELWCDGGEERFVKDMITQSKAFGDRVLWFTTLISKQSLVRRTQTALRDIGAKDIRIIPMGQGNKTSRILAWTYLNPGQQREWTGKRFGEAKK